MEVLRNVFEHVAQAQNEVSRLQKQIECEDAHLKDNDAVQGGWASNHSNYSSPLTPTSPPPLHPHAFPTTIFIAVALLTNWFERD